MANLEPTLEVACGNVLSTRNNFVSEIVKGKSHTSLKMWDVRSCTYVSTV